uniref:Uncharacterized protein n=1 Tax=Anguilla anguilla TaxID=7936 RepID=A0A0E9PUP8_ANGAN
MSAARDVRSQIRSSASH